MMEARMTVLALLALLQDPAYETVLLEGGPRADAVQARDLDGDGRPELLVQNGREIQIYPFADGRYAPKPAQVLRLDPTAFLWTLAALDGEKRPALLAAGSRAVQAHRFDGKAFGPAADLVVHPSIFEGTMADGRGPAPLDFAPDLDGDGRSDLLLFHPSGVLVLKQHAGGEFRALQRLAVPIDAATLVPWQPHLNLSVKTAVPLLSTGDLDGDRLADLVYYRDEEIGVFRRGPDGRFLAETTHDLAVEKRKTRNRFFQFDVPPRLEDFNGDGVLDLALIYPSKGRVQVYYGQAGRKDFSQADDLMRVADGWSSGIHLEDLDGDGKLDLVMAVIRKIGITEGIQVFLSGKLDIELHVYPMQAGGRFTKDPVQELRFSIPYSFSVTRDSASIDLVFRPNLKGDFNKDGLRDMLVATGEKTMRIYPGVRGKGIASEPSGSITMNPPEQTSTTEPFVWDLNGDGVSDLVLRHSVVAPARQILELKLSRP
jgi:hypothetical protein